MLDAALGHSICIPHLCRVPYLDDIGACRLCIVEHIENDRAKITTSCTLIARDGMRIVSNSEKVRKLRRNIAELLVTEAPNSRAIQDVALRCGVKEARYPFRNNDCVLCGRCVTSCTGRLGEKAIGLLGRGKDRHVSRPFDLSTELCHSCGRCVDLCPMTITPCDGPMKAGEGQLCGSCESKMSFIEMNPSSCVTCHFGEGFQCERAASNY